MERLLDATEELLRDQPFEAIGVQEIVRRAGSSVGAFYTRFRDKEALLPLLYERYDRDLGRRVSALERGRDWEGRELAEIVAWIVRQFLRLFGERRNLMRALALHVRASRGVAAGTVERRRSQHRLFLEAMLSRRTEIGHPRPERAVELALYFIVAACRERVLFAEATHTAALGATLVEMQRELTAMALGYLGATPTG